MSQAHTIDGPFIKKIWALIYPFWLSDKKKTAWLLLGAVISIDFFYVYITVLLNYWSNDFYNTFQTFDQKEFFRLLWIFGGLSTIAIVTFTVSNYLSQLLRIEWRLWMTDYFMGRWMGNKKYYFLQQHKNGTDNPDQRIADDIQAFTSVTLILTLGFLRALVTLGSFLSILWLISGPITIPLGFTTLTIHGYMFWAALLYAATSTWITSIIGKPLVSLNFEQERREANFRYSLVRLRENVEGIALYGGEVRERKTFNGRFQDIIDNVYATMHCMLFMNSWSRFYDQFSAIFPILLTAPKLFAKEIKFGVLMQTLDAFRRVNYSLSFFIDNFPTIAAWRATSQRLLGFLDHLDQPVDGQMIQRSNAAGDTITLTNLEISLPNDVPLLSPITLTIKPGTDCLITGPSGAGKSTLLRALAGLWRFGKGLITLPSSKLLFMAQKPYMPLGTLRDLLSYPALAQSFTDAHFQEVLTDVGLSHFGTQLDHTTDWQRVLSLGEQQRIAFARAILSKPNWLFLDEATSALEEKAEYALYEVIKEKLPGTTLVSVGHRPSLRALHPQHVDITPYMQVRGE